MAFCNECGAKNPDDMSFCAECGHPLGKNTDEDIVFTPEPSPIIGESQVNVNDQKVLSMAAYFWYLILFCIPVLGWVTCLIVAFSVKNKSLRNYSRAVLILILIALVMYVIIYFTACWVIENTSVLFDTIVEMMPMGESKEKVKVLFDAFKQIL